MSGGRRGVCICPYILTLKKMRRQRGTVALPSLAPGSFDKSLFSIWLSVELQVPLGHRPDAGMDNGMGWRKWQTREATLTLLGA